MTWTPTSIGIKEKSADNGLGKSSLASDSDSQETKAASIVRTRTFLRGMIAGILLTGSMVLIEIAWLASSH